MQRRSTAGDLIPIDLEINATCRRRNAERIRKFLQDLQATTTPEEEPRSSEIAEGKAAISSFHQFPDESLSEALERFRDTHSGFSEPIQLNIFIDGLRPQSKQLLDASAGGKIKLKTPESLSEALERFRDTHSGFFEPIQLNIFIDGLRPQSKQLLDASAGGKIKLKTPEEAMNLIENMAASDIAILRDRAHIPTKKSLLELTLQDALLQGVPSVVELTIMVAVSPMKNQLMKSIIWGTGQGKISMQVDITGFNMASHIIHSRDNGGITLVTNSTETRVLHLQGHNSKGLVYMSNNKSTESAIKNLEVQLADRPSSSFSANTEKNPKEECKAIMTRSRMAIQADEGRAKEKVEGYKQQSTTKPTLEPVFDLIELEEVVEDEDDQKERETPIKESEIGIKMKEDQEKEKEKEKEKEEMASKKRKAPATPSQAWERYTDIVVPRKIIPERNVVIYHTEFDEFKEELEIRKWDEELTSFDEGNIDVAIVKEFYANLYDPEDKSPKQVRVRGHLVKFDVDTLNTFLKTLVIIEEGEELPAYSRFALFRPDPQELAAKLCIAGRAFELNVLSYFNLVPTSHTFDITLDRAKLIYGIIMKMDMNLGYLISHQISIIAQHDFSRLGFPALIITLCKARGVTSDSRSLESLSPAINLAYIKKNCWNLDDPTVTFRGPRKARGMKPEAPPTSATIDASTPSSSALPDPSAPSTLTPHLPQLQSFGQQPTMSVDEFLAQVAWPGVQPSPTGGGEASVAQEPVPAKEPVPNAEDELTDPVAQEEATAQEPTSPVPISPVPISEDTMPSAPAMEPEQPILQDVLAAPVLDLNEDQPQDE
ncbi:hypothetical protein HKD37_12G034507 [Glycine soja]